MKRYRGTITSLIVFAVLTEATQFYCLLRGVTAAINGGNLGNALSVFELFAVLILSIAGRSTVLYFSKKEHLKPVYIIALVELLIVCFCGILMLVALAMGAL